MTTFFKQFDSRDFIAIFVLAVGFLLLALGIDKTIPAILTMIIGYYFGKQASHLPEKKE